MVPAAANSWIHVSFSPRHCLTSWSLNRPISERLLHCVILILVCRAGHTRRRSGRCDERIDLDVMRGWGQSVSLSVWHRDSRFHFHANLPCLFLNQTWPSQADDSRGLGPGDFFCLKPDARTRWYVTEMGKTFPVGALGYMFAHIHIHLEVYICTSNLKPEEGKKKISLLIRCEGVKWDRFRL